MPYPFPLPTTSPFSFTTYLSSPTHPSLPHSASAARSVLRNLLKVYRRLRLCDRAQQLASLVSALDGYIPYLLALDAGLSGRAINGEETDILLENEVEVEWRSCITTSQVPGRDPPKVKGKGLDVEIFTVMTTLACIYTLQARHSLKGLFDIMLSTPEQRLQIITSSSRALLTAQSIHTYLNNRATSASSETATPGRTRVLLLESDSSIQAALAALAHAEATLLAVLSDDPYPAQIAQERNKADRTWMIKAPELPKVRAHLFARLCLGAAESAGRAEALLQAVSGIDKDLIKYCGNLRRVSRAKACRFFGLSADLEGETGKGIAWLNGGKQELGLSGEDEGDNADLKSASSVLKKFKQDWTERREDKRIEQGSAEWGRDAGILEEGRVIAMLKKKWTKMNDKINTQIVPPSGSLLANMPSGRGIATKDFEVPILDEETLARMRAPLSREDLGRYEEERDSSDGDEDNSERFTSAGAPGAFPGGGGGGSSDYY